MNKLTENAEKLAVLFNRRSERKVRMAHLNADLEARTLALRPEKGWGPNPETRKENAAAAQKADPACQAMLADIGVIQDDLEMVGQEIDGLQELSKALRWSIREQLAAALQGLAGVEKSDDQTPGAHEFDDASDTAMDAQAVATAKVYKDAAADALGRSVASVRDTLFEPEYSEPTQDQLDEYREAMAEAQTLLTTTPMTEPKLSVAEQAAAIMASVKNLPMVKAARAQQPEDRGTPDDQPFRF